MEDDNFFVLQCMLSNIAKDISKHVPTRDLVYPTVMCTGLFSSLVYTHARGFILLKGNKHNKFYTLQSLNDKGEYRYENGHGPLVEGFNILKV